MVDTDTAGTVKCEVQAGASDAEGCGMDASDDFEEFEVFETRSEPAPEGVDVVGDRPIGSQGMAQTSATARMSLQPGATTGQRLAWSRRRVQQERAARRHAVTARPGRPVDRRAQEGR